MRRSEVFPTLLKGKEITAPKQCRVRSVEKMTMGDDTFPVLYVEGNGKGIRLNKTNWNTMEEMCQSDNSDDWVGAEVVVYFDPDVEYPIGTRIGGIRLRAPVATPALAAQPEEEIPF